MIRIQVAIVSQHAIPNLIPMLMDSPDRVYLVCSRPMVDEGERLRRLLVERLKIETFCRTALPENGLSQIIDYGIALADEIEREVPGAEVCLNATGGTKLMSFGLIEAFRLTGARILYTDTASGQIEYLPDAEGNSADCRKMRDVLDVPLYLAARGLRYLRAQSDDEEWCAQANHRKSACKALAADARHIGRLIGKLNWMASEALSSDGHSIDFPVQSFDSPPKGQWVKTLQRLAQAGLVEVGVSDHLVVSRFLHGGWLEEYLWHTLRDAGVSDVRAGVEVRPQGSHHARNEFDLLAISGNQLLFVECKTLRHHRQNDNELSYKIDSLGKDARGLFGETWLVTARQPTKLLQDRARLANIRLLGPDMLSDLKRTVEEWLRD